MIQTRRRRGITILLSSALAISCLLWPSAGVNAATKQEQLNQYQNQDAKLKQQIAELNNQVKKTGDSLATQKKQKQLLDQRMENARQQIALYDGQVADLKAQIQDKDGEITRRIREIAEREEELEGRKETLGKRLRVLSKMGNVSAFQMLLDTDSYVDYLIKERMTKRVAQNDRQLMDELEADILRIDRDKEALEGDKHSLEEKKKQAENLKKQADAKEKELSGLVSQSQALIKKLNKDQSQLQQNLKAAQQKRQALQSIMQQLANEIAYEGQYQQGKMFWPVPAVHSISQMFGNGHYGIDIANHPTITVRDKDIVAAADGQVRYASTGYCGGYGHMVVIDHGKDERGKVIHTVYAHMGPVYVTKGQKVVGGQTVLGKVGNTGDSQGYHLHFEVQENQVPVNPLKYVNK